MFLDEKKHGEAVTKTPSLRGLIAWLETKDPTEQYCFFDHGHCLMAQYYKAIDRPTSWVGGFSIRFKGDPSNYDLPLHFDDIAVGQNEMFGRWTFGAALARARSCL